MNKSKPTFLSVQTELEWNQPSIFKHEYELKAGDKVVARLKFPGIFSDRGQVEGDGGCWMFRHAGLFKPTIEIRECGKELPFATYYPKLFGSEGKLQLSMGRTALFRSNFWKRTAEFLTEREERLFSMKVQGLFRHRAIVTVHEAARSLREAEWILYLMWYIILLASRRRSSG